VSPHSPKPTAQRRRKITATKLTSIQAARKSNASQDDTSVQSAPALALPARLPKGPGGGKQAESRATDLVRRERGVGGVFSAVSMSDRSIQASRT
jgi:hypothetical protein